MKTITFEDTRADTWFERDRAYVGLIDTRDDEPIVEFWDEDVAQAVEDGFLNPKDFHRSSFEYAEHLGIIEPL